VVLAVAVLVQEMELLQYLALLTQAAAVVVAMTTVLNHQLMLQVQAVQV
jgi:hypothetical protein